MQELISVDDDIPVCRELEGGDWDEAFFSELGPATKKVTTDDDESIEFCSEEPEIAEDGQQ